MRVPVHRGSFHLDVVKAGDGHALLEVFNVAVAALAGVCVWLLVEAEVAKIEG